MSDIWREKNCIVRFYIFLNLLIMFFLRTQKLKFLVKNPSNIKYKTSRKIIP